MNLEKYNKKKLKLERDYGTTIIWYGKKRTLFGLPWSFTTYILTEDKFITKTGLFNITEDEVELYKIMDKKVNFPFFQRIFGCGTITLMSADIDTPTKIVKSIKEPREAKRILDEYISKQRDKYLIRGRDMIGAQGAIDAMTFDA